MIVKFASPQDRSIFTHAFLTRPVGKVLFLLLQNLTLALVFSISGTSTG
jgi:hypothetical protein